MRTANTANQSPARTGAIKPLSQMKGIGSPIRPISSRSLTGGFEAELRSSLNEGISGPTQTVNVSRQVEDLVSTVSQLRSRISELEDSVQLLIQENQAARRLNKSIFEQVVRLQDLITELVGGGDSEDGNGQATTTAHHPVLQPPPFNLKAKTFYVVAMGRCPGIYSCLGWATKMTANLNIEQRLWKSFQSYAQAYEWWNEMIRIGSVEMTGRTVGDEHIYGPTTHFIPTA